MRLLAYGVGNNTCSFLERQHFVLDRAKNGDDALSLLSLDAKRKRNLYGFDVLIADIEQCDMGALFPLKVRNCGSDVGIIMTGRQEGAKATSFRIKVLENGGDYCLMPLTDLYELQASISVCVRRTAGSSSNVISTGPITIDLKQKTAAVWYSPRIDTA